jgi:hypothetical protein
MSDFEHSAVTEKLARLSTENEMLHRAVAELMTEIVFLLGQRGIAVALPESWLSVDAADQ